MLSMKSKNFLYLLNNLQLFSRSWRNCQNSNFRYSKKFTNENAQRFFLIILITTYAEPCI